MQCNPTYFSFLLMNLKEDICIFKPKYVEWPHNTTKDGVGVLADFSKRASELSVTNWNDTTSQNNSTYGVGVQGETSKGGTCHTVYYEETELH